MYAINNKDAVVISKLLMGDYGREICHVLVTAYSFCNAFLLQVSHDRFKNKALELL